MKTDWTKPNKRHEFKILKIIHFRQYCKRFPPPPISASMQSSLICTVYKYVCKQGYTLHKWALSPVRVSCGMGSMHPAGIEPRTLPCPCLPTAWILMRELILLFKCMYKCFAWWKYVHDESMCNCAWWKYFTLHRKG